MAKLTKDEETQLLKDSVHKYIMSEEEFNVVEKILSSSHMNQGFDVIQIDNNDMFKDFEEDRVVPLQTGLSWMWEGLVEPTIDELTQDEKKTLSELLNKFDVLHGKKLNENLEIISSENTLFADSYTNEILDKIRAAGIEVITDKDKYSKTLNRIIEINVILEMLEDNPLKIEKGRSQLNADSIPNLKNIIDIRNNQEYYVNKIELLKHSCITFRFRKAS